MPPDTGRVVRFRGYADADRYPRETVVPRGPSLVGERLANGADDWGVK
jgi:hypothetical protein